MKRLDERNREMELRYRNGDTLAEIAREYGVTMQRVQQILRKRGVPRTARPSRVSVLQGEIVRLRTQLRARVSA
jgi:transposase-like protein